MQHRLTQIALAAGLLGMAGLGSGCTGMAVGAVAATGIAIEQERSVGGFIDDAQIHAQIWDGLIQESEVMFRKVGVEVMEGRVLLTGNVQDPEHRVEAVRIVWGVDGVSEVLNEIEVRNSSSFTNFAGDVWITTQLRTQMLRDSKISDINYSIETINGVVYLFGIAQDQGELSRVANHARNISGVEKVVSHVILKSDTRRES